MTFPTYTVYKDSGVEWLKRVPKHWEVKRLGHYFDERREKASDTVFAPLSVTKSGVVPRLETAAKTQDGDNRKKVRAGDFVINSRSDRKGSAGLSSTDGTVSLICIVLEPKGVEGSFVHHLLRSVPFQEEFYRYGKGIVADLWSTGYSEMKNIVLTLPPSDEQKHIATFLDHETARIDALVEEQQRLIALLKEKRQAVISHAVMDHDDGPKGKLGHYIDLLPGYAFPSSGFVQEGVKLLRGANIGVGEIDWSETVCWPEDKTKGLDGFKLNVGDLVFGMDRPWIKKGTRVAAVGDQDLPAFVLQRVARLRAKEGLKQDFLKLILMSKEFRDIVEVDMTGVSVPHISPEQINTFKASLPSEEKQAKICRMVFRELGSLESLITTADSSITLMQERRSALISAAVTGKIDVRGWQPPEKCRAANDAQKGHEVAAV